MENNQYFLGIRIYTDEDFSINNIAEINLNYYPDYGTYFMVKSWSNFENAKMDVINILNFIKSNIDESGYRTNIVEYIIKRLDQYIKKLDNITEKELLEEYKYGIGLNIGGNQEIEIEFRANKLSYNLRNFALDERLRDLLIHVKHIRNVSINSNDIHNETWSNLVIDWVENLLEGKNCTDD